MLIWEKVKISENHETFWSFYFPGHTLTQSCNKSNSLQPRICQIYVWQKLERGQSVTKGGEHNAEFWPNCKFCFAKSSIQGEGEYLQLPLRWRGSQCSQPVPVQIGGTKGLPALRVSGLNCFLGRTEKILNNFPISGGRDLSGRLQRACECQSWFWGGFPFPQQGKGSLQQLWSHCLEGRIVACLVDSVYLNTHPLSLSVSEQEQIGKSVSEYFIFQFWAIDIFFQVQEKNEETFRDLRRMGVTQYDWWSPGTWATLLAIMKAPQIRWELVEMVSMTLLLKKSKSTTY